MAKIDPRFLKGLKFHGSEGKEIEENGRRKMAYHPIERDVIPDDVLDWKDYGDKVVVVIADGRKYDVPKKGVRDAGKE